MIFSSHLFQNENIAKTNVPEFEIAGYKQSSQHVRSTETTKCYLLNSYSTLFHLLPVKCGRKKYRNDTF